MGRVLALSSSQQTTEVGGSHLGHCSARDTLREKPRGLGHRTTYIEAGHIHPIAHNHIDEVIWRAVFSEEYLSAEDL